MSRAAARIALLIVVFGSAACSVLFGSSSDDKTPASVVVKAGEKFTIELEANPSTGFAWELGKPLDEGVVALVDRQYVTANGSQLGASGKDVWTFTGVAPGWTTIQLNYRRPWEDDIAPARIAVYSVEVQ